MSADVLLKLRPKANTAEAIEHAIGEAEKALTNTKLRLAKLEADRGAVLIGGTVQDVKAHEASICDTRIQIEQLDAFLSLMAEPLAVARRSEAIAALQKEQEALDYTGKRDAFVLAFQEKYPVLAAEIADILNLEITANEALWRHRQIDMKLNALGVETIVQTAPAYAAVGGGLTARSLGEIVRLPGRHGAPAIPIASTSRHVDRQVRKLDWDAPGPKDPTGKPIKTKLVIETQTIYDVRPSRSDTPYWWDGRPRIADNPVAGDAVADLGEENDGTGEEGAAAAD